MTEQPPPAQTPYGQPNPYGQPQGQPQDQPQGPPQGQPQGQPQAPLPNPYGQPAWPGPGAPHARRRPGTVTAAAWVTILVSGVTAVLFALVGAGALVATDQIVAEMAKRSEYDVVFSDTGLSPESLVVGMGVVMLVLVIWAAVAVVLGIFVLRRSNVARILLVVSSVVAALVSLLMILSVVSVLWLIACVTVAVLLFVGGANEWFRGEPALPPGPVPWPAQTPTGPPQTPPGPPQTPPAP